MIDVCFICDDEKTCLRGVESMNRGTEAFVKIATAASWVAGALLSVYFMASWPRFCIAAVFVVCAMAACGFRRIRICAAQAVRWIDSHPSIAFLVLCSMTVVVYVGLAKYFGISLSDKQFSDYKRIWQGVQQLMSGTWPVSKSWTSTVFYAFAAWCSGGRLEAAVLGGIVLHFLSGLLAFDIARKLGGPLSGVAFAAFILLSPILVLMSFKTSTENLYVFFVLCLLWIIAKVETSELSFRWLCLGGVVLWCTVWSRGEGVVAWATFLAWVGIHSLSRKYSWRRIAASFFVLAIIFALGAVFAVAVNLRTQGVGTFLCSNDNMWPRLIGANQKFNGRCNREDKPMIRDMMIRDGIGVNGEKTPSGRDVLDFMPAASGCPVEALPYVKAEISRRWASMDFRAKIRFVWRKWHVAWHGDDMAEYCSVWLPRDKVHELCQRRKVQLMVELFPSLIALGCILFHVVVATRRMRFAGAVLAVQILMLGHFAILAVTEVSPRYGIVFNVACALPAALAVGCLRNQTTGKGRTE